MGYFFVCFSFNDEIEDFTMPFRQGNGRHIRPFRFVAKSLQHWLNHQRCYVSMPPGNGFDCDLELCDASVLREEAGGSSLYSSSEFILVYGCNQSNDSDRLAVSF